MNVNNLFTVDASGSVFNNGVTFNDSVEFNAVGDLAVANDLVFTNNSFSKLRTATDLSIEVGEPFNSSNLNLVTYNNGVINLTGRSINILGTFSAGNSTLGTTNIIGNLSAALGVFTGLGVNGNFSASTGSITGNFSAGSLFVNGYFSAANTSLGATTINGLFSAGNTTLGRTNIVGLFSAGNSTLGATNIVGLFSAGSSTLGATNIVGNISGTGNISLNAQSFIAVSYLSSASPAVNSTPRIMLGVNNTAATNTIVTGAPSDIRLKDGIKSYNGALDIVSKLETVTFNYRNISNLDETLPGRNFGFIAQQVETVLPEIVANNVFEFNGVNYKGIDYGKITPILVSAIQEQQTQISTLSSAVSNLNLTSMQTIYDNFMNTIDNLSMSTENG